MQLGPGFIIECPHCGGFSVDRSWASGNTFGGMTQWTDGSVTDCMMPPIERPFIKCYRSGCMKTFWIERAKVLHRISEPPNSAEDCERLSGKEKELAQVWLKLSRAIWYQGIDDCHQAIQEKIAGKKKENWRWLRTFTWHEATSPFRGISETSFPLGTKLDLEERHASNLAELLPLMNPSKEEDRLQLIEIHRQSGDFSAAAGLVDFDWSNESQPLVTFFKILISCGDMILRRMPRIEEEPPELLSI